jgi:hypothetical protein
MKNINILLVLLFSVALFSCEEDEYPKFDKKYVAFTSSVVSISEGAVSLDVDGSSASLINNTGTVTLIRSTTDYSQPLTVNLSVNSVYSDTSAFANGGDDATNEISFSKDVSTITFAAGEATSSFDITSTEDLESAGNIVVTIAITSVSDNSYSIGEASSAISATSVVFTVVEDDCPIDLPTDWAGTYTVTAFDAAPGSFNEGFSVSSAVSLEAELVPDGDPLGIKATLKAAPGGFLADDMPITFNTCPETISFSGDYTLGFSQNSAPALMGPSDEPLVYGSSIFDPANKKITFVVGYGNTASGLVFDEFIVVLEKQ